MGGVGAGNPAQVEAELRCRKEEHRAAIRAVRDGRKAVKEAQAACRLRVVRFGAAQRRRRAQQTVVKQAQRHVESSRARGGQSDGARKRLVKARQRLQEEVQAESDARRALQVARANRSATEHEAKRCAAQRDKCHAKVKLQGLRVRQVRGAVRAATARAKRLQAVLARHAALRRELALKHKEAAQQLERRLEEEVRGLKRKIAERAQEDAQRRKRRAAQYASFLRSNEPLHADKFHRAGASELTAKAPDPDFSGRISVLKPKGQKHEYTLVYLHQFCLQGTSYVDWKPHYFFSATKLPSLSLKVTLPTAKAIPVTVHGGIKQYAWYDYKTDHDGRCEDELFPATLRATRDRIFQILDREIAFLGGDASRVFLGGASQGCCTALHCFLQYPRQLGGFVGVVGHLLSCTPLPAKKRHLPIYLYNGREDQVMRWSWVKSTYARFKKAGYTNVRVKVEDGVTHTKPVRKEREWIHCFLAEMISKLSGE